MPCLRPGTFAPTDVYYALSGRSTIASAVAFLSAVALAKAGAKAGAKV